MKTVHDLLLILVLLPTCSLPAASQSSQAATDTSDVRIVSSFVAAGAPVPKECRKEAYTLALNLVRYPRPASWHWVLVCDEAGWRRFLRLSGRDEQTAIYASTDLAGRTTYIRGAKLLYPNDLQACPAGIIAHELAHIRLQSDSEAGADDLVRLWQGLTKPGSR